LFNEITRFITYFQENIYFHITSVNGDRETADADDCADFFVWKPPNFSLQIQFRNLDL